MKENLSLVLGASPSPMHVRVFRDSSLRRAAINAVLDGSSRVSTEAGFSCFLPPWRADPLAASVHAALSAPIRADRASPGCFADWAGLVHAAVDGSVGPGGAGRRAPRRPAMPAARVDEAGAVPDARGLCPTLPRHPAWPDLASPPFAFHTIPCPSLPFPRKDFKGHGLRATGVRSRFLRLGCPVAIRRWPLV